METLEPKINKRLLNPIDRISEILFGLIMALTFTCTISIIESDRTVVKDMLIGAIGCNIAWGLVDAVMYLLMTMTEKGRGLSIFNFVRKTDSKEKAHQFISDALPPVIASVIQHNELEEIRKKIIAIPDSPPKNRLKFEDFKTAFGIFILVFLSTFPIAIPFILTKELQTALRVSNAIAILMMFICGWGLGQYSGRNRFFMGAMMSLIGVALVLITISLGG
ncbi:MAG: hypothetical protein ACHQNT_01225 [Bacteroidia bacterium]